MTNPFPIGELWYEICETLGHDPYHCPMMKKYQTMPKSTFCNIYKSIGNEDKDSRTLEIMKERTSDAYRMQDELMTGQHAQQYNNAQQFTMPPQYNQVPQYNTPCTENQGNRGGFRGGGHGRGGFGRGKGPVTCHNF
jgi:hypothetical protein